MKAIIIGSGEISDYARISEAVPETDADCFVICCDGGAAHAKALGLTPGVIVGDLDSIDADIHRYYSNLGVKFEKYPPMKDYSDMEIGLIKAFELGAEEIIFLGATGSRADHSLCNIGLLFTCLTRGIKARIIDDNNTIFLINKKTVLPLKTGQTVSLIPFTEKVAGITTEGLKYPLVNESLKWGTTRGVSNVCEGTNAAVDLKSGVLIAVIPIRP